MLFFFKAWSQSPSAGLKINFICLLYCIINLSSSCWGERRKSQRHGNSWESSAWHTGPNSHRNLFYYQAPLCLAPVITFPQLWAHLRNRTRPLRAQAGGYILDWFNQLGLRGNICPNKTCNGITTSREGGIKDTKGNMRQPAIRRVSVADLQQNDF